MQFFTEYQAIFSKLNPETLIITPNQRLSRFLTSQFGLWHQGNGKSVWPALRCLSLNAWVRSLWDSIQVTADCPDAIFNVMTPAQERALWLQAIESEPVEYLLSSESMADLCVQAWRFLHLWALTLDDLPQETEESILFNTWARVFKSTAKSKQLIGSSELIPTVIDGVLQGRMQLPKDIICIGFDDLTPLDQSFINALVAQGVDVKFENISLKTKCIRVELPDRESEIRYMARWAAKQIELRPKASVGLVIPDLANLRPMVERIFTEVFEPQYILPDEPRHAPAFNISAAQPLAHTPLIASALSALQLNKKYIDGGLLAAILKTPFLGVSSERPEQIKMLASLQQHYIEIPISALKAASAHKMNPCPNFHTMLVAFSECMRPHKYSTLTFSAWAMVFAEQLSALGWPGERELDTLEFQQLSHWPELLIELGKLDKVLPAVNFSRALSELNALAYVPFHAQTCDSPVQVLGVLEAAGQQFDSLWVMGLDYRAWPEVCKPNPLISVSFQRDKGMPRSSMDKELQVAKRLTDRLTGSAYNSIFSSTALDGDQPLRPSPLIDTIPLKDYKEVEQFCGVNFGEQILGATIEGEEDAVAPMVTQAEGVRGGTQVLKNQAACPFRAFAKHRLYASVPEVLQRGVSALVRGNLMHQALELIWNQLETQEVLINMDSQALGQLIDSSIEGAWLESNGAERLGLRLKSVESERTKKLISVWLTLEKERAPFRVKYHEKSEELQIGGMALSIRYDRMDELIDGGDLIVLDYKTGSVDIKNWAGDRPDDPQVPLYCVSLMDKPLVAAALAQLNVKEVAVKGISPVPELLPGLKAPDELKKIELPEKWNDIQLFWKSNLACLASDFMQGKANVDPKSSSQTCTFCDLKSLCRVGLNKSGGA